MAHPVIAVGEEGLSSEALGATVGGIVQPEEIVFGIFPGCAFDGGVAGHHLGLEIELGTRPIARKDLVIILSALEVADAEVVIGNPHLGQWRQFVGGKVGDEVGEAAQGVGLVAGPEVGAREIILGAWPGFVISEASQPALVLLDGLGPLFLLLVGAGDGKFDFWPQVGLGRGFEEIGKEPAGFGGISMAADRSEERRVGKECRSRWS